MNRNSFVVRRATIGDVAALARHRVEMFRDMGELADGADEPLRQATMEYLCMAMPKGEYVAWVASPDGQGDKIAGGVGLHVRSKLPRARPGSTDPELSPEGLVVNVFTEREWRRQGVAAQLMQVLLAYATDQRIRRVVLHASPDGRSLYEQLGFAPTNEMRYSPE